jgi:hypothetical protein
MDRETLAIWLYDELDPDADMEPDACCAILGPHPAWSDMSPNDQSYWLKKADELIQMFRS